MAVRVEGSIPDVVRAWSPVSGLCSWAEICRDYDDRSYLKQSAVGSSLGRTYGNI